MLLMKKREFAVEMVYEYKQSRKKKKVFCGAQMPHDLYGKGLDCVPLSKRGR